jgi:hypothetical protein
MKLTTAGNRQYVMPFQAPHACSASGCLNGGTCNAETGMCKCVGDSSCVQCGVAPCDTLACNALTSSCDLTTNSKAACIYNEGSSGDRCNELAVSCPGDASVARASTAPLTSYQWQYFVKRVRVRRRLV